MNLEIESLFGALGGLAPVGETFTPVTEDEVAAIETSLGAPLPRDYRDFLRKYGASSFEAPVQFHLKNPRPLYVNPAEAPDERREYPYGPLSHFFGSAAGKQGLAKNIKTYRGRMPDTMIPIADDGGGHKICLGVKGGELGKVFYWDHNNEWDEDDYEEDFGKPMPPDVKFQNVYLIAEAFADFVRRLEIT